MSIDSHRYLNNRVVPQASLAAALALAHERRMYASRMLGETDSFLPLGLIGYIDAGSGSYLLAAIASGAAGTWFFIRSKMSRLTRRKPQAPEADGPASEQ